MSRTVTVSFLVWRFDISLSTVTVAAVLAGIVVAQLLRGLITKRQEKAKSTVEFVTGAIIDLSESSDAGLPLILHETIKYEHYIQRSRRITA